jgi:hypothetical protein
MKRFFLPVLVAISSGCNSSQRTPGAFDTPSALAVLEGGRGPFTGPVGYAANLDGGRIAVLDLVGGGFLADDPTSILDRGAGLATGESRRIGALAVLAGEDGRVDVLAADKSFGKLLRVPHIVGTDNFGAPLEIEATASEVSFFDADSSGDAPELADLVVFQGAASTEEWQVRFDGRDWWVEGTRSGRLPVPVTPGQPYTWDRADDLPGARQKPPFTFVLTGTATEGDAFEFATENGLTEHDTGGTPLHLALSPDMGTLAVINSATGTTRLSLLDPASLETVQEVGLPLRATPGRMAWSPGGTLFVADNILPAFYEVTPDGDVTEHPLPWPSIDVAYLDTTAGERLVYVVPTVADAIWLYDLDAGELRDVNAWVPGVQGMPTQSQIRGIGAIQTPFPWPEEDNDGAPRYGNAVAVSLLNGYVQMLEEGSGCFLRDFAGPRTAPASQVSGLDVENNFGSVPGAAFMQGNGTNGRAVQVNPCGGTAWSENWRARFDQALQAWVVEGSLSGRQQALAYEGQRYISDRGEVSFLIRAGSTPSIDGWEFTFQVRDGLFRADGDNDLDNRVDVPLDLPGDPIGFTARPREQIGAGWQDGEDRAFVLVAAEGADLIARIEARYGFILPWW